MLREAGVEPAAARLSIECSNHTELFPDGAPCQTRTGFSGLQVRRIAIYAYRACDSGANGANRTLIGRLPCDCSATELHRLEAEGYSKPRPPRYECGALPLELLRRGASAENRTPFFGQAIRCPTNRPHPQKPLERTEIIEISSLGWRPRTHPIYHGRSFTNSVLLFSCQRPALRHTSTASLPAGSKLDEMLQITDKTKKEGGHFWWPPSS